MRDGGLRRLFQNNLKEAFWVPIETWSTSQGVPDAHFIFPNGASGWIEHKQTSGWAVTIHKEQVAWLDRYARHGGRCFVAVRRTSAAGPRKGAPCDELYIFRGADARGLMINGIKNLIPLIVCRGGMARWNWPAIRDVLTK